MSEEPAIADTLEPLIRDLVEWVGHEPRPYREVLEAWRTSCPRLMVWEEASERGYVERGYDRANGSIVSVTERGRRFVEALSGPPRDSHPHASRR